MGGISAERDVSIKSGKAVFNALKKLGYNAVAIEIVPDKTSGLKPPPADQTTHLTHVTCNSSTICDVLMKEKIEIAFLVLHGGYGENGAMQGLLEITGIPCTGSGVLASALAMDKAATKKILLYHRIPVPPFKIFHRSDFKIKRSEKNSKLRSAFGGLKAKLVNFDMPWVVKPATEGSSIGVSIVRDKPSLDSAMKAAFRFCERVIIEKHIDGKEIHVGILNDNILGAVEVRSKLEFYNYRAKYTPGLTEYILPPEMQFRTLKKAEKTALSAHMALGCKGATRVDLIVDKQGKPYVLEVNTIPGMTETSLLPKIAGLSGLDFSSLIEEILKGAIKKGN